MLRIDTTDMLMPGASTQMEGVNGDCWGGCCANQPSGPDNGNCVSGCCNGGEMEA